MAGNLFNDPRMNTRNHLNMCKQTRCGWVISLFLYSYFLRYFAAHGPIKYKHFLTDLIEHERLLPIWITVDMAGYYDNENVQNMTQIFRTGATSFDTIYCHYQITHFWCNLKVFQLPTTGVGS